MPEEICIPLPPSQLEPKPFYRTRRGLVAIAFLLLVLLAGLFSWWLARGKIASTNASLDMLVYTVAPEFPAKLKEILVEDGQTVAKGQPLAIVESSEYAGHFQDAARDLASLRNLVPAAGGENPVQAEKEAAAKLAQARFEEDRLRKLHQEAVAEHVRAQLGMRSINPNNRDAYSQAAQLVNSAKTRMTAALEEFERASLLRAGLEKALNKLRAAILAARRGGNGALDGQRPLAQASSAMSDQLVSPVAGTVLRVAGQQGQTIPAGDAIFLIQPEGQTKERWIRANFPLKSRSDIHIGQKVSIRIHDLHLSGKIEEIDAAAGGQYVACRISLDNPEKTLALKPGIRAECQILTRYVPGMGLF